MRVFKKPILIELQEHARSQSVLAERPTSDPIGIPSKLQKLQKRITPVVIRREDQESLLTELNPAQANQVAKLKAPVVILRGPKQQLPALSANRQCPSSQEGKPRENQKSSKASSKTSNAKITQSR